MTIKKNPNSDFVSEIEAKLKQNDGYCPCSLLKTPDTKCMCKEFKEMIEHKETGTCHCGLYTITQD